MLPQVEFYHCEQIISRSGLSEGYLCSGMEDGGVEDVVPEPDTDSQGLEGQFLRRSGWQVVSREQSMLKEREKERERKHSLCYRQSSMC